MKRAFGTYLRLARLASGELRLTGAATVCLLLVTAADVGLLLILERLVDTALAADDLGPLLGPLAAGLGLALGRELASYGAGWLETRAETSLNASLQHRLFDHLHTLSLGFFGRQEPGRLLAQLFQEAPAAARLVLQVTRSAVQAPTRAALLFGVLVFLDAGIALLATLVVLPAFVLSRLLGGFLRRGYEKFFGAVSSLYGRAGESFAAIELVKVFDRRDQEVAAFRHELDGHAGQRLGLYRLSGLEGPAQRAIQMAALAVFFGYGARAVASGSLTAGALTSALIAAYAFLNSLHSLASVYTGAQQGLVAAENILALLDEQPKVVSPAEGSIASFDRILTLENVAFAYPGHEPILDGLTLRVRRGERVALVGRSGAGKTTLLRLLLRLYDPDRGTVRFDGIDARALDLASLHRLFAVVLQDSPVVSGTIRQNIVYGTDAATPRAIGKAVELAGLDGLLARAPGGLDSVVGSRGLSLSGGERQRLALARAVIRDAPILLLDEATSHLDSLSERQVHCSIDEMARHRTVLTVAHRLSTLVEAERIVFIEAGRIGGDGRHADLLTSCDGYARLCAAFGTSAPMI